MKFGRLLLTCEHGGNRVPSAYASLFAGCEPLLAGHQGLDIGALAAAQALRRRVGASLIAARITRLLVDLNRSPGHPRQFSELTRGLPVAARKRIIARYYAPYRRRVEDWIAACVAAGHIAVHVSVHSFTGALDGRPRGCDIGLLYDPSRPLELAFCQAWQAGLAITAPEFRVRRNYPYKGVADGLVTWLRTRFAAECYVGVELELNQARATGDRRVWRRLIRAIGDAIP